MLFFKSKQKSEEILPPPPPFAQLELEEKKEKPKFFDEIIKPKKAETFPEVEEFKDLVKGLEESKPKKAISEKVKISVKKRESITKKPKLLKKEVKQLKRIAPVKKLKKKKIPIKKLAQIKQIKEKGQLKPLKEVKKTKVKPLELEENLFKDIDLELQKELEKPSEKELELSETFDIESFGKELEEPKAKPKEIEEAEEEIKSAIEKIKEQQKPSFFKRLFSKEEKPEEQLTQEIPEIDEVSIIKNNINKAREALLKFDLETAKKNYIEVIKLYNNMKPEEQAKVYQDIKDLYFERKSAEELKV